MVFKCYIRLESLTNLDAKGGKICVIEWASSLPKLFFQKCLVLRKYKAIHTYELLWIFYIFLDRYIYNFEKFYNIFIFNPTLFDWYVCYCYGLSEVGVSREEVIHSKDVLLQPTDKAGDMATHLSSRYATHWARYDVICSEKVIREGD